jgi:hypothetical protein
MSRLKLKVNNSIFNKIAYNCLIIFQDYLNIKILKYDEKFANRVTSCLKYALRWQSCNLLFTAWFILPIGFVETWWKFWNLMKFLKVLKSYENLDFFLNFENFQKFLNFTKFTNFIKFTKNTKISYKISKFSQNFKISKISKFFS